MYSFTEGKKRRGIIIKRRGGAAVLYNEGRIYMMTQEKENYVSKSESLKYYLRLNRVKSEGGFVYHNHVNGNVINWFSFCTYKCFK